MGLLDHLQKLVLESSILKWCFAGFIVLVCLSLHTKWKQHSSKRVIQSACKDSKQTIFVALIGEHSTLSTAQALFSIFEQASCPMRVNIGVYELIDDADGNAIDMYKIMSEKNSSSGLSFESRVTVLQRYAQDGGPYNALRELMEHAYKSHDYVFTLNDSFQVQKGWDKKLIDILSRNSDKTALTLTPTGYPSFPVLSDFLDGMPVLGMRSLSKAANVSSKFWFRSCSFSPSSFWKQIKFQDILHLNSGTDVLITSQALINGWKFLIPAKHNIIQTLDTRVTSLWSSSRETRNAGIASRKAFNELSLKKLGMNHKIDKEPLLGIVDASDEEEVSIKYGSRADYLYLASKL